MTVAPVVAPVLRWVQLVAGTLAGAEAMAVVLRVPGALPLLVPGTVVAALLVPGGALVVAGWAQAGRASTRPVGWLLGAAGVAWFVAAWNEPAVGVGWAFALGRTASALAAVLALHAVLLRLGSLRHVERIGLAVAYGCAGGLAGMLPVLVDDPARGDCRDCPTDPFLIVQEPAVAAAGEWLAALGGLGWATVLAGCLLARLGRTSPVRHRLELPVSVAGIAVATVTGLTAARALAGRPTLGSVDGALWLCLAGSLLGVVAGTAWPWVAVRLTRLRLIRLVTESDAAPSVGALGATLGTVLRNPTVRLLYPVGGDTLVDVTGAPVASPAPPIRLTRLQRGPATVAVIAHAGGGLEPGPVLDEISRAARLTLDNERLHAEHAWQLRQLQDSRRRLVAATDRERRVMERDLHDGAQQALVALALGLSLMELRSGDPDRIELLRAAGDEVTQALVALRSIALGVFPRELGDEGLAVALDLLAERAVSPIRLDVDVETRPPAEVEAAAYFTLRALLAPQVDAVAEQVSLRVRGSITGLLIDVVPCQPPTDRVSIEDRVGALGGTFQLGEDPDGRPYAHLELSCAS